MTLNALPGKEELNEAIEILIDKISKVEKGIKELKDGVQYIICFVESVDVPGREVLAKVLTDKGLREVILRCFTDSIALQILEEYSKGKSKFVFRMHPSGAVITQVMDNKEFPDRISELSNLLNRPMITSTLSREFERENRFIKNPLNSTGMRKAVKCILDDWNRRR